MIKRTFLDIVDRYRYWPVLTRSRGQVAVEYVLLLLVGVTIVSLIISLAVSRNPENPGFLIAKWRQIIELIGTDVIDP